MDTEFNNIPDMKNQTASSHDLQNAFEIARVNAANELQEIPLDNDVWLYAIIVAVLALALSFIIVGALIF